jgi:quercetin dioxygenase-like cupin family protein
MKRIALALSLVVVMVVSTRWIGAQPPPPGGADPRFTGRTDVLDGKDLSIARRRFEAGARAAWHSHEKGQLLFVEQGRGRVQRRGEPMRDLRVGDSDYTGPNVVHWHGAAPDQAFVQINVGFGGDTKWLEPVTDAEYQGKGK